MTVSEWNLAQSYLSNGIYSRLWPCANSVTIFITWKEWLRPLPAAQDGGLIKQKQLPAWSGHRGATTQPVVLGEGGRRDVLCSPTRIWGCCKRLRNPNGTWSAELLGTPGSAAHQYSSFRVLWVPLSAGERCPELCLLEVGRRAGPKRRSLQQCHCHWPCQIKGTNLPFLPHLESTAASLRHRFVARNAVLTLPASQNARRLGEKVLPFKPLSPPALAGAPQLRVQKAPVLHSLLSCVPLSAGNVLCQKQPLTSPSESTGSISLKKASGPREQS